MAPAFDPTDCLVLISAWPDRYVAPELFWWLDGHGIRPAQVQVYGEQPHSVAVNKAIRDLALGSRFTHFLFIEHDIRPDERTDAFLKAQADVVAGYFPIIAPCSWRTPTDLHLGLWRTSRSALEKIQPPYVQFSWTADGCDEKQCPCLYLRDKLLAAGLTVERQAAHRGFRIQRLCNRDQRHAMTLEDFHHPREVHQRAGEPVNLVDDDGVDLPGLDITHQTFEGRPVQVAAGVSAVIVAVRQARPALVLVGQDVRLGAFALGVERVEVLLQALFGALAGVDRAARGLPGRDGFLVGHGWTSPFRGGTRLKNR